MEILFFIHTVRRHVNGSLSTPYVPSKAVAINGLCETELFLFALSKLRFLAETGSALSNTRMAPTFFDCFIDQLDQLKKNSDMSQILSEDSTSIRYFLAWTALEQTISFLAEELGIID